jgi:hypothetical protein
MPGLRSATGVVAGCLRSCALKVSGMPLFLNFSSRSEFEGHVPIGVVCTMTFHSAAQSGWVDATVRCFEFL